MKKRIFETQLKKCIASFSNQIKREFYEKVDRDNIEIYINDGYLTLRYESENDTFRQEIAEINGELCNLNLM